MNTNQLTNTTRESVENIEQKFNQLLKKLPAEKQAEIDVRFKSVISEPEAINRIIEDKYELLKSTDKKDNHRISEIEKSVFNSIASFNEAYIKAGVFFDRRLE